MGDTLGKYKVLGRLGKGGMGEVYRAVHTGLEREVALKVLSEESSAQKATERFLREAQVQAKLEHTNLVRLYDVGEASGRLYIAMEMVTGQTLSRMLNKEGRPHPSEIARIGGQMAAAFAYFHPLGLVHRDIKPSNIMLTSDEARTVKIMDFGIAFEEGAKRLTRTRAVVGTARYLSPEMARGATVTDKSDIYQLGLILYELLCGRPPHDGPAAVAIARRAGGEKAPDPRKKWPACPDRLARLVNALLAPDPADRPDAPQVQEECEALELRLQGWTAPEGPLEPWRGEEEDEPSAGYIPSAASSAANQVVADSGKYSGQLRELEQLPGKSRLVLVIVGVVFVFMTIRWWLTPVVYRAQDIQVTRGARGAVVTWESENSYRSKVRFGPAETAPAAWSEAVSRDDGREHRVVIEGLDGGQRYGFHVVFPNGKHSLDHKFQAPESFEVQRVSLHIVGEDAVEWRFRTPVEAKAALEVTTHDGRSVRHEEAQPTTDHAFRFSYADVLRPPRAVSSRFEAADGEVEARIPTASLSLEGHLTELFSERSLHYDTFFNQAEAVREELSQAGAPTTNQNEVRTRIQAMVKKRFGATGVLENWSAITPRISELLRRPMPWAQRMPLVDSLLNLTMIDRLYDLHSLPPVFRAGPLLVEVARGLPREPEPQASSVIEKVVLPYKGNLLVPSNYSGKARNRINTFSTTVFPTKGAVATELTGTFKIPAGTRRSEVMLGMEARGLYPFQAVLMDIGCAGADMDNALTLPFLKQADLSNVRLYNEIDFLRAGGGQGMEEIFPVERLWMQVPKDSLCDGENQVRLRLLAIQHLSFFPIVARRVFVHVRTEGA